ncbi:MAG: hypothetical protein HWQ38_10735 [Nostoc sp. NMS7]|uniref:hypothetical protein n=1 Tax=Nostoc sp. NMS7 TaxID=2815391 RepID=UPI0025E2B03A|nr:hypothetical protein [Nostoc sp. NMS7]MBN3946932.1 hypothetical protein [Nostoc sp. NMS7]
MEAAALPEWVPSLEAGNQSEKGLYFFLVPFHSELKFLDNRVMDEPVHLAVEGCLQLELESKANLSASVLLVKPL